MTARLTKTFSYDFSGSIEEFCEVLTWIRDNAVSATPHFDMDYLDHPIVGMIVFTDDREAAQFQLRFAREFAEAEAYQVRLNAALPIAVNNLTAALSSIAAQVIPPLTPPPPASPPASPSEDDE